MLKNWGGGDLFDNLAHFVDRWGHVVDMCVELVCCCKSCAIEDLKNLVNSLM